MGEVKINTDLLKALAARKIVKFHYDSEMQIHGYIENQEFDKIYIYRYTHINNIKLFINDNNRITNISHELEGYIHIGSDKGKTNFQNVRDNLGIVDKSGNHHKGKDFIPFFLCPNPPMLYNIRNGTRGAIQRSMDELVCMVFTLDILLASGVNGLVSGNLKNEGRKFVQLEDLPWQDLYQIALPRQKVYSEDIFYEKLHNRMSEFLHKGEISLDTVKYFIVNSNVSEQKITNLVGDRVHVNSRFFG